MELCNVAISWSGGLVVNMKLPRSLCVSCLLTRTTWACFLSLAQNKLRLCSASHRAGYFSNLPCDWLSIVWAHSKQETENGPRKSLHKLVETKTRKGWFNVDLKACIMFLDDTVNWYQIFQSIQDIIYQFQLSLETIHPFRIDVMDQHGFVCILWYNSDQSILF